MKNKNENKNENNDSGIVKNANKNLRSPLGNETSPHKMIDDIDNGKAILGRQLKHDWGHYTTLPQYEGHTFFGCLDNEVDSWIEAGAQPVEKRAKARKVFPGLNDNPDSKWEFIITGRDEAGNASKCYLFVIPTIDYKRLKLDPLKRRVEATENLMAAGVSDNDGQGNVMPNVTGIRTYASETTVEGGHVGEGLSKTLTHEA